jgi:hypothetical protein
VNKYLAGNPIDILLDEADPIIRYLALRDIQGANSEQLHTSYARMVADTRSRELLSKIKNGIIGNAHDILRFDKGSGFLLAKVVCFGFDCREEFIPATIEAMLEKWQNPDGGIHGPWEPQYPDATLTGEIISLALQAEYVNDRVRMGIEWICSHQRHDGGWLYAPISGIIPALSFLFFSKGNDPTHHDRNQDIPSCTIATAVCTKALLEYHRKHSDITIWQTIQRGAQYLISNHLNVTQTIPTLFNYTYQNNASRIGYPVFLAYDKLHALLIISRAGLGNTPQATDVFNSLITKQNADGMFPYEHFSDGMIFRKKSEAKGVLSEKWSTLNFLRVLHFSGLLR